MEKTNLTFEDALRIAEGCLDYSGGYDGEYYTAFQNGIWTVINALSKARDVVDSQTVALYKMARWSSRDAHYAAAAPHLVAALEQCIALLDTIRAHPGAKVDPDMIVRAIDDAKYTIGMTIAS